MTPERSAEILSRLRDHYGPVRPDLRYRGLYQLTVAVILSAQTTDRQVNSVTGELFSRYPGFPSLAEARPGDVEKTIRSTGFYRQKSKNIIELAKIVTGKMKGRLPRTREELTALPGIGRKSANIILSIGYGEPALAVDTHVMRIANRLAYVNSSDPYAVEKALTGVIPREEWTGAHLILIRHGRSLCAARKPLCHECPVNDLCPSAEL